MKIVVTGANGFIGRNLVRRLVADGHEVVGLVRPAADRSGLNGVNVRFFLGDVTQPATLVGAFDDCDAVIHAAGKLGEAGVPESAYHALHVGGTTNVLDAIVATGQTPRVMYVSSPGVLGPIEGQTPADETWPYAPSNAYERSKCSAEKAALSYADRLPIITIRPEFCYGGDDEHVLGLFSAIQRGLFFYIDGGKHVCHPTHIDDAIDGMLAALQHGQAGEVYHITGPNPVSFREFGVAIAHQLNVSPPRISLPRNIAMLGATMLAKLPIKAPLSPDGVAFFSESRRFSWQKAHHAFGYTPNLSLDEGVARSVAWYKHHGYLP